MHFAFRNLGLFCALVFLEQARANPFEPEYKITLGDINIDGGLELNVPLVTFPWWSQGTFDIRLEHQTANLDYHEAESLLVLRPFQTNLVREGNGVWRWTRPGGGTIVLVETPNYEKAHLSPPHGLPGEASRTVRCFVCQGITCWEYPGVPQVICDDGWQLGYDSEGLKWVRTPDAKIWEVVSHAGRIDSLSSAESDLVVRVNWEESGKLIAVSSGKTEISLRYRERRLLTIEKDRVEIIKFDYGSNGLVSSMSLRSRPPMPFDWASTISRSNADQYVLPYILSRSGNREYSYTVHRNNILITSRRGNEPPEKLTVKTLYGRIVSISND